MSAPDFADFARPREPCDPDGTTDFAVFADFAHVASNCAVPLCHMRVARSQSGDAKTRQAKQDRKQATCIAHPTAAPPMAVCFCADADGYLPPRHGFATGCPRRSRPRRAIHSMGMCSGSSACGPQRRALRHRPSKGMRPIEFHWLHGERGSQSRSTSVCGSDDLPLVSTNPPSSNRPVTEAWGRMRPHDGLCHWEIVHSRPTALDGPDLWTAASRLGWQRPRSEVQCAPVRCRVGLALDAEFPGPHRAPPGSVLPSSRNARIAFAMRRRMGWSSCVGSRNGTGEDAADHREVAGSWWVDGRKRQCRSLVRDAG